MDNLDKAARMAGQAFENGIRLHRDSIKLFEMSSYPSAFQLSVLAQEEIGKALLIEDYIFYSTVNEANDDIETSEIEKTELLKALRSHQTKQQKFSYHVDEGRRYGRTTRFPKLMRESFSGKLDQRKQNAIYVGLTLKNGKVDPNGRISSPSKRVKLDDAKKHITRVSDYLLELSEGVLRDVISVDTENVENYLTSSLINELEKIWPYKSVEIRTKLVKLRKIPLTQQ